MFSAIVKLYKTLPDRAHIDEYLLLRRRRVSTTFVLFILGAVSLLSPVCFLVLKSPVAGFGTLGIGLVALVSLFFILKGYDRISSAFMLSIVSLLLLAILAIPVLRGEADISGILVSVLVLTVVTILPAGVMVRGRFAIAQALVIALVMVILLTLNGNPALLGRRAIIVVGYFITGSIIAYLSRLQNQLLDTSVKECVQSKNALAALEVVMTRIGELKRQSDAGAAVISSAFDSVSSVVNGFMEKSAHLSQSSQALTSSAEESRSRLAGMLESVESVAESVERQGVLAREQKEAQERMNVSVQSIQKDMQTADEANGRLARLAQESRESLDTAINSIRGLLEYQSNTLEIVGTLSKISAQTNLLAMNAAIEAAHAGNVGSGFAVVAESVRDLADSSSLRTREINGIVRTMNGEIETGVARIETIATAIHEFLAATDLSREMSARIVSTMDGFAQDAKSALESVRELEGLAMGIRDNVEREREISKALDGAFVQLEEVVGAITGDIGALDQVNSRAKSGLEAATAAHRKSAEFNRAIDELLAETEGDAGMTAGNAEGAASPLHEQLAADISP